MLQTIKEKYSTGCSLSSAPRSFHSDLRRKTGNVQNQAFNCKPTVCALGVRKRRHPCGLEKSGMPSGSSWGWFLWLLPANSIDEWRDPPSWLWGMYSKGPREPKSKMGMQETSLKIKHQPSEWSADTCYDIEEPWKHYANWEKPDMKAAYSMTPFT